MEASLPRPQSRAVERQVLRIRQGEAEKCTDALTAEEPLEIRVQGKAVAVTMRTPRDDFELAAGFLYTEGLIQGPGDLGAISYCSTAEPPNEENVVEVRLRQDVRFDPERLQRHFYASSSCGICGKASIEAVRSLARPLEAAFSVSLELLYSLDEKMRRAQAVFERTGSLHAAALFDEEGELLVLREDVGRHNAVDKVVGSFLLKGGEVPRNSVLMVSGRAGFEIAQKALVARIPFLAAVSAPSSLAVDLAMEANMTLVGFLRGRGCNVYAGAQRVST